MQIPRVSNALMCLTGTSRERARLPTSPVQTQIELREHDAGLPGVAVSELAPACRTIAGELIEGVLSTYPAEDVAFARRCIEENGGVDRMFASYYRDGEVRGSGSFVAAGTRS